MTQTDAIRCCAKCGLAYRSSYACCPSDGGELQLHDRDPLIGATVGPYEIEALIGEGGMSRVYRARHSRLQQRKVAVKVLLGDFAADLEMRLRFAHEAELASSLNHPNIVSVLDYGVTDRGMTYLAMQYVEGGALSALIDDKAPLPLERVLALGRGMCRGLAHAHAAGVVHRDFKPDNVLIVAAADGEVARIADFGLAITSNEEVSARFTQAGIALGTPLYAAPEQTHGDEVVDSRADLFGLGVTLYEMTAGKLPYDSEGGFDAMRANATGKPPPIAERTEGRVRVPAAFDALLRRMLARKASDRPATALEVLEALNALDPAALPMEADAVSLPARRHGPRRWAAIGAVLAVAGGVGLVVARRDNPPQQLPAPIAVVAAQPAPPMLPPAPPVDASLARGAEPPAHTTPARRTATPAPRPLPRRARDQTPAPPPAPVQVSVESPIAPEVPTPAPAPVPVPVPVPLPAPVVKVAPPPRDARITIEKLAVRGSLSASVLHRGIERVLPAIQRCYVEAATQAHQRGNVRVRVALKIDDTRRAVDVQSTSPWAALSTCARSALGGIRTSTAPDVGSVGVQFDLSIVGVP